MKTTIWFGCILLLSFTISCAQRGNESQTAQPSGTSSKAAAEQSARPFEITAEPIQRVKEWQPAGGGGITLTRGVSMKLLGGSITGLEAEPGFELAVIRLKVTRRSEGATLSLDNVSVYDDNDKKYPSAVGGLDPLGKEVNEIRQFAFAVPTGTILKKIELARDVAVDLK
ncbi:MAG: hypothetical protein ABI596_04015 [Pyrinomonadaceae bacterium]